VLSFTLVGCQSLDWTRRVKVYGPDNKTLVAVEEHDQPGDEVVVTRVVRRLEVASADGVAERRLVRLGEAVGSRFEVLEGIEPGDLVVVRGNERLRPGQAVRYQDRIDRNETAGEPS